MTNKAQALILGDESFHNFVNHCDAIRRNGTLNRDNIYSYIRENFNDLDVDDENSLCEHYLSHHKLKNESRFHYSWEGSVDKLNEYLTYQTGYGYCEENWIWLNENHIRHTEHNIFINVTYNK